MEKIPNSNYEKQFSRYQELEQKAYILRLKINDAKGTTHEETLKHDLENIEREMKEIEEK